MDILECLDEFISSDSLRLFAQPQISLLSHQIIRQEVLLRFPTKLFFEAGPKTTTEWIKEIKRHFGLRTLTYWLLEKVAFYLHDHVAFPPLAINVSPSIIDEPFIETLVRCFNRYDVPLRRLALEITEDCEPVSFVQLNQCLNTLRSYNMHVALDDFGVGYSTIKNLMYLTIDSVKLDQILIQRAFTPQGKMIIQALVTLIKNLSITVVCEGIETNDHLDLATTLKVDCIQGFFVGKPELLI